MRERAAYIDQDHPDGFFHRLPRELHGMIRARWNLPKPMIAAVHGFAAGTGMGLALAADLRLAAADAASTSPS